VDHEVVGEEFIECGQVTGFQRVDAAADERDALAGGIMLSKRNRVLRSLGWPSARL
jgi:hypothetical protein